MTENVSSNEVEHSINNRLHLIAVSPEKWMTYTVKFYEKSLKKNNFLEFHTSIKGRS